MVDPKKTMFFISVACIILMVAVATAQNQKADGGSRANNLSGTSGNSIDADRSAGVTGEFRLLGIAFSNSPGQNLAIIETGPDRHQRFIHEGDSIGDMLVKKILSDQVVFETDRGERIARLNSIYLGNNNAGGTPVSEQTKETFLPTVLRSNQTVLVDREGISSSLAAIDKTIQDVKISPVRVYSRTVGVRVSPVEPGSVFDEIGLKNGDIIKAVNGKTVNGSEAAVALLKSMRAGGEFNIFVKGSRRSRTIQLIVN